MTDASTWPGPPIAIASSGGRAHLAGSAPPVADEVLARLGEICAVDVDDAARSEAGRDWWPLALHWAKAGQVPALPAAVVRPSSEDDVVEILRVCNEASVPVTPHAGRSGVCGGSVAKAGGVALDMRGLTGIVEVADEDLLVRVRAGTHGLAFEEQLRAEHSLTCGHWPQSVALASVGGWVACRGAGQYSTRYGKIEDITAGLSVVLADGTVVRTGGRAPRSAVGPDLTQLFVGSEGALAVITEVMLRVWPLPSYDGRQAWIFTTFEEGLDACRRALRRGVAPAVLRLYDGREAKRFGGDGQRSMLLVLDEGEPAMVDAGLAVVAEECGATGTRGDVEQVAAWLEHRNDVSALGEAVEGGIVVDTCEVAGPWSRLAPIYQQAMAAKSHIDGLWVVSAHQSHSYPDGACLYFTFAGQPTDGDIDAFHTKVWDHLTRAALDNGGALSHHHGVGLLRSGYTSEALGSGYGVLAAAKAALDPKGILNPGAFGLPSEFGVVRWP